MGKWDNGVRLAIKNAKKNTSECTWTTKHDRPEGKELYETDPISVIPGIGKKSEIILKNAEIFTVSDCVEYPELLDNLNGSPRMVSTIKNRIQTTITGFGVNRGSCPPEYQFVENI